MAFERGTFDPKADPYPGSVLDKLGVPQALAGSVGRFFAFTVQTLLPRQMRVQDLLANARIPYNPDNQTEAAYRARIRSPLTAIRAWCVTCSEGPKAAWHCDKVECPLFPFHRGKNGMRNRK